ncbi:ubiquitin-like protein (HubA) [Hirsutella rhossiliensis]|uniref:Ubiquitin-like modifier HUB1 n=1 Tax=Hirsutella rhossiliensis TaxID=111463 RepID=A0A9P8N4P4_9HYPO|nr:ubiquitin-like protein (HubA) [Hirsutella rhossiliensis]KAH0966759.1 ubiquitin-like protein (HubA) [Hirsutella rhossiliensis]
MADNSSRRSRSRSPPRRAPRGSKGFRWKDSARGKEDSHGRDRQRPRDRDRERDRDGERDRGTDREGRLRSPRPHDSGSKDKGKREKKAAVAPAAAGQEMIIVHVNDRLGTKSAIPCLPSDTIGQLKLMVAARIGRESSQIMLRRQGERPFKDQLSLEDYGISNGVQLDLELDTGD